MLIIFGELMQYSIQFKNWNFQLPTWKSVKERHIKISNFSKLTLIKMHDTEGTVNCKHSFILHLRYKWQTLIS